MVVDRVTAEGQSPRSRIAEAVELATSSWPTGACSCSCWTPTASRRARPAAPSRAPPAAWARASTCSRWRWHARSTATPWTSCSRATSRFNAPYGACPDCLGIGSPRRGGPHAAWCPIRRSSLAEGAVGPLQEPATTIPRCSSAVAAAPGRRRTTRPGRTCPPRCAGGPAARPGQREGARGLRDGGRPRDVLVHQNGRASLAAVRAQATHEAQSDAAAREAGAATSPRSRARRAAGARLKPEILAVTVDEQVHPRRAAQLECGRRARRSSRGCQLRRRRRSRSPGPIVKEIKARLKFLVDVGLDYLTLERGHGHAFRRRGAAHPPGHADRRGAHGRALHPGRAVHRAAPARQRAAHRHAGAPARPGQHRGGGRARRGHHPRRPTSWWTWAPAPASTAARWWLQARRERGHAGRRLAHRPTTCPGGAPSRCREAPPQPTARRAQDHRGHARTTCEDVDAVGARSARSRWSRACPGSGKSSLVTDTLAPALANRLNRAHRRTGRLPQRSPGVDKLDKVINIDQSPIGRTPRSNPATYIGLWDDIRPAVRPARQEAKAPRLRAGPLLAST